VLSNDTIQRSEDDNDKKGGTVTCQSCVCSLLAVLGTERGHLPPATAALVHTPFSVLISSEYWAKYDLVGLSFHILRIVALFGTAAWLYWGGVGLEGFLLPRRNR